MNKIEYLCQYHNLLEQMVKLDLYIKFCDEKANEIPGTNFDKERIDTNRNLDAPFVKWLYKKLEAEDKYKKLELDAKVIRAEIEETISNLNDPELVMILNYRYIEWMTWNEISKKLYLSVSTIRRKHRLALEKLPLKIEQA